MGTESALLPINRVKSNVLHREDRKITFKHREMKIIALFPIYLY